MKPNAKSTRGRSRSRSRGTNSSSRSSSRDLSPKSRLIQIGKAMKGHGKAKRRQTVSDSGAPVLRTVGPVTRSQAILRWQLGEARPSSFEGLPMTTRRKKTVKKTTNSTRGRSESRSSSRSRSRSRSRSESKTRQNKRKSMKNVGRK